MYLNILFLALVCGVTNVLCKGQLKIPCALDDSRCTTSATRPLYKSIVDGIPEIEVPTSEPLHQNVIYGFVHDMNYTLTDAYLYGIKNCTIQDHKINVQHLTWNVTLHCPFLVMKGIYEVKGIIGGNYIEGKGPCEITHNQYHIGMRGGLRFYEGVDNKAHMVITYFDFDRLEVLGNIKYNLSNLYYGDNTKCKYQPSRSNCV
ncbi:uncharacterized protein LOC115446128 [Manduca sexta]|uniref:uncharacterized protein LOC115446128 n=1 Tax=Manduca sexta TaxID=7130 RepID=UPI00188F05B0|nr:uncharacterized protein LOC115446128 [Manduca sexta]